VPDPLPDERDEPPASLSPVPIVIALVVVLFAGILASVFLRSDDEGVLVRPDRLTRTGDDTIRAVAADQPDCGIVERAQVDLAEDRIYVELVVVGADGPCPDVVTDIVADLTLPQPVGDRRLVPGVGRFPLPCIGGLSAVSCEPDR
jgi:hypothetical protein